MAVAYLNINATSTERFKVTSIHHDNEWFLICVWYSRLDLLSVSKCSIAVAVIKKFSLLNHTHGLWIRTIVSSVVSWSSLLRWLVVCFHSPRITWLEVMWINEHRRALNSELTQEEGGVKKTANRVWQASNGFVSKRSSPNFPVFFNRCFVCEHHDGCQ